MKHRIRRAIADALRALADRLTPPVKDARMDPHMDAHVYVLAVQHRDGFDTGGAAWLFDQSTEFEKAKAIAAANPKLIVTYKTENYGMPDYFSDAHEFKRWAEHVTSKHWLG